MRGFRVEGSGHTVQETVQNYAIATHGASMRESEAGDEVREL